MEEIRKTEAELKTETVSMDLLSDFVAWIDRSERTSATYLCNLKQFAAWMSFRGVTAPQRADIIAYRDYLMTEHEAIRYDEADGWAYRLDKAGRRIRTICKPTTVNSYLHTVKEFFAWADASGIYPDVAKGVHAPRLTSDHKKEALEVDDVKNIELQIKTDGDRKQEEAGAANKDSKGRMQRAAEQEARLLAIYELTVNAGLRTVEVSRLNVGDLVRHGSTAYLYIWGKGHSSADVKKPIALEVADSIDDYLQTRADGAPKDSPMFIGTGNRSGGKRILPGTISQMIKKAMISAGYDDERITAHSLRHTTGQAVMEMTGNLYDTQKYLRHANPATTEIYLHQNDDKRNAENAERLYAYFHA